MFFCFFFGLIKDPPATKAYKERVIDNITISHIPCAYIKVRFGEGHCKWLITVENPILKDGDSMLLRVFKVHLPVQKMTLCCLLNGS